MEALTVLGMRNSSLHLAGRFQRSEFRPAAPTTYQYDQGYTLQVVGSHNLLPEVWVLIGKPETRKPT